MKTSNSQRLEGYLDRLFGFAVSLVGEREEARDLVQDCAVKVLSARQVPADEPAYRAWLFRILRNRFVDRLRYKQRRPEATALDADTDDTPGAQGPIDFWRGEQHLINTLTVRLAMARLAPREREIIALIDVAGLTYREAAEALQIPPGTVMSRISRARQSLLVVLNESNVRAFPKRTGPKRAGPKRAGKGPGS